MHHIPKYIKNYELYYILNYRIFTDFRYARFNKILLFKKIMKIRTLKLIQVFVFKDFFYWLFLEKEKKMPKICRRLNYLSQIYLP